MERITSKSNPAVIAAAKLSDKKYREKEGVFFFEGIKLFREARAAGVSLRRVFVTDEAYERYTADLAELPAGVLTLVSEEVYEKLSAETAPQGVFTVAEYFAPTKKDDADFVLFLDGVADPGNLGAVIRSADAFGVDAIYLGKGSADLYNPKTVRACMGSLFRVPVYREDDLAGAVKAFRENGFAVYATALDSRSRDIRDVSLSGKLGFVIGNEGHGISAEVLESATGSVIIPMREGPESLNAAVASGVVLWEAARVRLPRK